MKRQAAIVLLLLVLSIQSEAMQSSAVDFMQLSVVENGSVETPMFRLERVAVELLMPQRFDNQFMFFEGDVKRDGLGNTWALVEARNPPRVFTYEETFLINVSSLRTDSLPAEYDVPASFSVYIQNTPSIQSNDSRIKDLAAALTKDARSDFERISLLAAWVHDNVKYDRALRNESKDALWVLENRRGTCDEYATLFIALARSLGLPARFVAGYYHGNGKWEEHAFAEVYLGRWIPVDPTNLDVGRLDATHLRFAVSDGNSVGSRIVYDARAEGLEWESDTEITILNYTEHGRLDYKLSASSDSLSAGDSAVVVLRLWPEEYMLMRASLQPCVSSFPFVILDNVSQDVILVPGRENVVYWKAEIAGELQENMRYTCPLVLNSKHLAAGEAVLTVEPKKGDLGDVVLSAELSDKVLSLGRNETVFVGVEGVKKSSPIWVGVVSKNFFREYKLFSGDDFSVSFEPREVGRQEVVVYTSAGEVVSLEFEVLEQEGAYIDDVKLPSLLRRGASGEAVVYVHGNSSALHVKADSEDAVEFPAQDSSVVRVPLLFDSVGSKRLRFWLEGAESETVRVIKVYDVPEVSAQAYFQPYRSRGVVVLEVSGDYAKNVVVSAGNQSASAPELFGRADYEFSLSAAEEVFISYEDESGEVYSLTVPMESKNEGLFEMLARIFCELSGLC